MNLFNRYVDYRTGEVYPLFYKKRHLWNYDIQEGLISKILNKLFYAVLLGETWYNLSTGEQFKSRDEAMRYPLVRREFNWLGRFLMWYYSDKVRHWQKRSKNETLPTNLPGHSTQNNS